MLIKKETFSPLISTIPDDTALFSILDPHDDFSRKFIMENFINFCSYRDKLSNIVFFRFENSMDYKNIEGLECFFIPIDLVKKYYINFDFLVHLLIENYYFIIPIDKSCIDFYGKGAKGTHLIFVYGADTRQKHLFCKDFSVSYFTEFEVPFKAIKKGVTNFLTPFSQESDGFWAFRINRKIPPMIEYAKVYSEFYKLCQTYTSSDKGYGIGAIDLYLNEIHNYIHDIHNIMSWYVVANYLREAAKLMKARYSIIMKEVGKTENFRNPNGLPTVQKILRDTDILFFKICRLRNRNIFITKDIFDELLSLTNICKNDFELVADFFCQTLEYI